MPTYAYACTACDHDFEAVQSFTDASLTKCPECGGRLRKVFGSVGVVFKGSGFYRNDSRSSSKPAAAKERAKSGESTSSAPAKEPAATSTASSPSSSAA